MPEIKDDKIGKNRRPTHLSNGKFAPGNVANPHGRPIRPEIELLRNALEAARKKHGGKHLIEHAVDISYIDNNVLIAILKKIIPDKIQGEGFGNGVYLYVIRDSKGSAKNSIPIRAASKPAND